MPVSNSSRREFFQTTALLTAGGLASLPLSASADEVVPNSSVRKLKITAVKTYLLRHKLKRPFGVSVSVPLDKFRQTLLVKIETNAGLVGWGETAPINGSRGTIDDHLAPRLIGQNPLEHRRLWRLMWGPNFGNALAVGALDMSLNDLRGKALNMSVAELFGGRLRDRVPVYASAMNYVAGMEPEDHFPQEAAALVKRGYRALKMRIGRYSVAREAKVAAAIRETVGPKVRLMADGNAAYTMATAVQMGHELHKLGFEIFEEPLPQSPKYAGYEELRRKLPLSLAAGEAVDSRASAKELIDRRAMDIIQPDISLCGGIGEALFIAEMASLSGIRCIPHCWGSDIVIAATTQLLSLLPDPHWGFPTDTPMLELDQSENPWRNGLARQPIQVRDGYINVSRKPGLGIEVDEDVVKKYAV
ncbi:MAG: mandelate racemase/muconate lactonizing enzyme family protein [Planctomycetaceae bacterium]|nr:mandelate racemase/muconate lactonizing enzyme family protein [Planctomycetaceae bacterium]MBT6156324.1 mandelate racemase/muconate lactonizing enzyme family protein [Planctomycetaceae bacterium]MBT6483904.1 mandelate racemase/muconate lactonizing enzyme family protein [Planctomycetaceae bacterium]MBT6496071.1 mandelate racemase/muconate lactonizing enzyme family protein [Planctomycetaceae bacterium]